MTKEITFNLNLHILLCLIISPQGQELILSDRLAPRSLRIQITSIVTYKLITDSYVNNFTQKSSPSLVPNTYFLNEDLIFILISKLYLSYI